LRRFLVRLDDSTDALLRRMAAPGQESAFVRAAIIEKAARDDQRSELDELRQRVQRIERKIGLDG
jgi:hypothetical protein